MEFPVNLYGVRANRAEQTRITGALTYNITCSILLKLNVQVTNHENR